MKKFIFTKSGMFGNEHGHYYSVVDVDARIAELEKALREIRSEAGSHTVSLSVKPQPGAGHVYVFDLASKALGL